MSTSASASMKLNKKMQKKSRALNFLDLDLALDQITVSQHTECYQDLIVSLSSVNYAVYRLKKSSKVAIMALEFNNSFVVADFFNCWKFAQNIPSNTFSDDTTVSRAISIHTVTSDREFRAIS